MTGQQQRSGARYSRRDTRCQVISRHVGVNNLELFSFNKAGDLFRAEHSEGIPDRDAQEILRRYEIESILPLVCRPKSYEDVMSLFHQSAAQPDELPLRAAVRFCR